jgi:hypothetical protein
MNKTLIKIRCSWQLQIIWDMCVPQHLTNLGWVCWVWVKCTLNGRGWSWVSWLVAPPVWDDCEHGLPVHSHVALRTPSQLIPSVLLYGNWILKISVQSNCDWYLWICDYGQMISTYPNWFDPHVLMCCPVNLKGICVIELTVNIVKLIVISS